MNNKENFEMMNITNSIKDVGNNAGSSITKEFEIIGDFFKNIFRDFSKYLNMLSCVCCIILCLCCCFMYFPILLPLFTISSNSDNSIDF